jgi:hypothetical protein
MQHPSTQGVLVNIEAVIRILQRLYRPLLKPEHQNQVPRLKLMEKVAWLVTLVHAMSYSNKYFLLRVQVTPKQLML